MEAIEAKVRMMPRNIILMGDPCREIRYATFKETCLREVCEGCGEDFTNDWESPGFCQRCERVDRRLRRIHRHQRLGIVEPFYVVTYGIVRRFGGPEEGGWWYDSLRIIEVRKCWGPISGLKHARELREEYPTCPRGRHSVIGGEDIYTRTYYDPEDFPEETYGRPRYE